MENNKITKDPMTVNEARFVSLAPHIRSNDTVRKIMLDVIIALVPVSYTHLTLPTNREV